MMGLDLGVFLVDDMLVKTDRASMANSLEARVPLLDPVVAELALALPTPAEGPRAGEEAPAPPGGRAAASARDPRGQEARVLAADRALAPERAAADGARALSPEAIRRQGFFDPGVVTRLIDDHAPAGRTTAARSGRC